MQRMSLKIDKQYARLTNLRDIDSNTPGGSQQQDEHYQLPVMHLPEGQQKVVEEVMVMPRVITEPEDHNNFIMTFNYFLDMLLVDFSQTVEQVNTYEQFLNQDM